MKLAPFSNGVAVRGDRNKIYYGFIHNFTSPHTRDAYTRDLRAFLLFLKERFHQLDEFRVEHAHAVAYKDHLIQKGYHQKSMNRKLAALWSFYDYLLGLNLLEKNPFDRVKRFKVKKMVSTQDLSDAEVLSLLESIDSDSSSGKLHRALLTLFFTTGMRHREVSHLQFKNLDEENGFTVIRYMAKGDQEMVTPLNPKALEALGDYLRWCESENYSMSPDDYVFRATKNPTGKILGPLNPKTLNYIIKRYAKKVGVTGKITIHSARSTVIGMLLSKGHALEKVADFVGHKDISMTKAYNKRRQGIHQSLSFEL